MRSNVSRLFFACIGPALLTGILYGCGNKTARKKMLTLNSQGLFEAPSFAGAAGDLPFYTSDIEIQSGGTMETFVAVSLPDPANDSLAMNLVNSYKPFALPLLTEWGSQERKGVLIDLRSNASPAIRREDYVIERADAFSIPVVFLWDPASANRAAAFIGLLQSLPAVHCRRSEDSYHEGRQDCFQPVSPCIGCR